MSRIVVLTLVALISLAPLTACGKKGKLEQPSLSYSETR